MLFRIVHYSEWPKLRPAHLFFLGSAFEQLDSFIYSFTTKRIPPPHVASFTLFLDFWLRRTLHTTSPKLGLYQAPANLCPSDYAVTRRNGHSNR
jgi:hypothetical protein